MKTIAKSRKRSFRTGFMAGLLAGLVASGVMILISTLGSGLSLPEVVGSKLTALTPLSVFAYLHELIGADAKYYLFYVILAGQCVVFGLSGGVFDVVLNMLEQRGRLGTPPNPQGAINRAPTHTASLRSPVLDTSPPVSLRVYHGLLLAAILWLFTGLVLLPLTDAGIFGSQLNAGVVNSTWSLAVVGVVFGLLFVYAQNWLVTRAQVNRDVDKQEFAEGELSRRDLLKRGAVVVGLGLLGVGLWRFITGGVTNPGIPVNRLIQHFKSKITPPPVPNYGVIHPARFLSAEVTSNDQYYVVSKNLVSDPIVNGRSWNLAIDGQVEHPFILNYQEVLALPMQKQYESMMCISNEVGGQYMSNALWEGVRLMDLLERAGVKPGASKVVFQAVDNYSDSIHLSKALEPTTLMAVYMNGVPLPQNHGFPARMLVPGIYGMKHCKWLTRIEVVNYDYRGYWQQRGWSDAAPIRMTARIDTPLDGTNVAANRTTYIAGVAFSGKRGISEVDVSTDGGQTWQRATLKQPLSALTWVVWELEWRPKPGNYLVTARAIDLEGNVQSPIEEPPLPDGSLGYHTITVMVS
jgi:DMSO/TMAO reductase YedYZ molybdopterin-dependent catalytic subunit